MAKNEHPFHGPSTFLKLNQEKSFVIVVYVDVVELLLLNATVVMMSDDDATSIKLVFELLLS